MELTSLLRHIEWTSGVDCELNDADNVDEGPVDDLELSEESSEDTQSQLRQVTNQLLGARAAPDPSEDPSALSRSLSQASSLASSMSMDLVKCSPVTLSVFNQDLLQRWLSHLASPLLAVSVLSWSSQVDIEPVESERAAKHLKNRKPLKKSIKREPEHEASLVQNVGLYLTPLDRLGLSRRALTDIGLPSSAINRLHLAVFVYSLGFEHQLRNLLSHSPARVQLLAKLWRVRDVLMEEFDVQGYKDLCQLISKERQTFVTRVADKNLVEFRERRARIALCEKEKESLETAVLDSRKSVSNSKEQVDQLKFMLKNVRDEAESLCETRCALQLECQDWYDMNRRLEEETAIIAAATKKMWNKIAKKEEEMQHCLDAMVQDEKEGETVNQKTTEALKCLQQTNAQLTKTLTDLEALSKLVEEKEAQSSALSTEAKTLADECSHLEGQIKTEFSRRDHQRSLISEAEGVRKDCEDNLLSAQLSQTRVKTEADRVRDEILQLKMALQVLLEEERQVMQSKYALLLEIEDLDAKNASMEQENAKLETQEQQQRQKIEQTTQSIVSMAKEMDKLRFSEPQWMSRRLELEKLEQDIALSKDALKKAELELYAVLEARKELANTSRELRERLKMASSTHVEKCTRITNSIRSLNVATNRSRLEAERARTSVKALEAEFEERTRQQASVSEKLDASQKEAQEAEGRKVAALQHLEDSKNLAKQQEAIEKELRSTLSKLQAQEHALRPELGRSVNALADLKVLIQKHDTSFKARISILTMAINSQQTALETARQKHAIFCEKLQADTKYDLENAAKMETELLAAINREREAVRLAKRSLLENTLKLHLKQQWVEKLAARRVDLTSEHGHVLEELDALVSWIPGLWYVVHAETGIVSRRIKYLGPRKRDSISLPRSTL